MGLKGSHVTQVLAVQQQRMATTMAQLSEMNNEKAKLSTSIKLQEEKVELCKKGLQNAMDGDSVMIEGFKAIESALIDVKNVAKTQMS